MTLRHRLHRPILLGDAAEIHSLPHICGNPSADPVGRPPAGKSLPIRQLHWCAGGSVGAVHRRQGIISAPAVAGDTLYVGDTLGKMYAVDAITGAERWQFQGEDGILVSPIVVGDLLVFGDKAGWLYGLGRAEGMERWRLQLPAGVRTEPVYAEGQVLVRTDDGGLHAIR